MGVLAFVDKEGVVVFVPTEFNIGVKDIIHMSDLTPVIFPPGVEPVVGEKHNPPGIKLPYDKYEVGDLVFVHHYHANFRVFEMRVKTTSGGATYEIPSLEEINPRNPKMPHRIYPVSYCNHPKVSKPVP